ncbi:MAG: flagellar basal-body rod protein FlgF [Halobacteriovoraceae bacterium]|nr:flagellar basal-body rod protein FlgF [Halobacteriovoraceae bacterium]
MKDIWVPVSGQIAQQRKVDTIANNIANANTTGFKKDGVAFREYLTALNKPVDNIDVPHKEWSPKDFYHSQGAESAKVLIDGSYTDFSQGQLKPTSNPFDFALYGKGFFQMLTPNGIRYTRQGSFNINKDGILVDNLNNKVLLEEKVSKDENAQPEPIEKRYIQVPQGVTKLNVSLEGTIYADGQEIGKLAVTEFEDLHALKKEGSGLFINPKPTNVRSPASSTSVHQGYLEGSNVNAISEMSQLIKAHRHFENIQKAIKIYDDIHGKAVNDISKF